MNGTVYVAKICSCTLAAVKLCNEGLYFILF